MDEVRMIRCCIPGQTEIPGGRQPQAKLALGVRDSDAQQGHGDLDEHEHHRVSVHRE